MLLRLLLMSIFAGTAVAGPVLERTILLPDVTGRIDHLAFDPAGGRLFVAALGHGSVEVVDLKQGQVSRSLPGFAEPQGVLLAEGRLYVACGGDGTVRVLDGSSLAAISTIPFGDDADNLRYDPAARRVYVGYGGGALGAIDALAGAKLEDLPLRAHPESFQLEAKGSRIFVNLPGAHAVAVLDRASRRTVAEWSPGLAAANYPMALDENRGRLYVACRLPGRLLAFDLATGRIVARQDLHGDCDDLYYDAGRDRLYAACGEGFIDVFSPREDGEMHLAEAIPTRSGARTGLLAGDRFYLAVPRHGAQPAEIRCYHL